MLFEREQMAIIFEKNRGVATLTLNRPEVLNAIDPATYAEITDAFLEIDRDPEILVAIVTGAGDRAFTAGADLKLMHGQPISLDDWHPWQPNRWDFGAMPLKPLIAAVHGYVLAGGLELALACDIRIAAANAVFGTPEVKWNLLHGYGAWRLPRIIPMAAAMEMLLTGEFINADRALQIGLVSKVVEPDSLMPEAQRIAEVIAGNGRVAVQMTKELAERGLDSTLAQHFRVMREYYDRLELSADQAEGLEAFRDRRKPSYGNTD